MIELVNDAAAQLGVAAACDAVGLPRATYYRAQAKAPQPRPRPKSTRALTPEQRQEVLDVLHEPRFVDWPPAEIYARLLDEDTYLCSIRTMYRILADNAEVRERRRQRVHPPHAVPRLCATAPNQVWTWDITSPSSWAHASGRTSTCT